MDIIYLDNSASTRPYEAVANAVYEAMRDNYGNPSSLHTLGVKAERAVKAAREAVAKPLKVPASDIYFTSGGTESNNLAILGAYSALRIKGKIITAKTEHKSVLEPFKTLENAVYLDVDSNGLTDIKHLESIIDDDTSLVSIMHVNNETGVISPIAEIARSIKRKNPNCLFHVDAVQSYCKIDFPKGVADLISVSAHKIHGPKGIGALYVRKGVKIIPRLYGGAHEGGIRSGTLNTPAIIGFGIAAQNALSLDHAGRLNEIMRKGLSGVVINSPDNASPYILNISAKGLRSEIILHSLEQRGVIVSSGSACSSNRPSPSHVLTAMGLSKELVDSSIRISFSALNTEDEVKEAVKIINEVIKELKSRQGIM
ncbi:MAG: Cysteine desulfurase [Firmicutes bacterium ADurb.Bin193]|nr:MAG: Cysteine desulfurase [Firmicutes bacterium ADurb.Bin193]